MISPRLAVTRASRSGRRRTALTCLLLLSVPATAAADEQVMIQVGTLLARDASPREGASGGAAGSPGAATTARSTPEEDERLAGLKPQLVRLFRYGSYRLMDHEDRRMAWGSHASFDIPGGRHLRVVPTRRTEGGVALQVALVQGEQVLMNSDLTLGQQGKVLVGGPGYEGGVLIIWIGAHVAEGQPGNW
ncbi:MAG: hypothetical protein FJ144_08645 [Deltaproteobacteria bacterium]|nr:hypothetical protein [Deltaproteobacteria bacterium]